MPFSKNLFSIGISIFQVNHLDNETLCKHVEYFCTNPNNNKIYTRDMGLDNSYLKELNEIVIERSQIILNGITNYPNLKVFLQKECFMINFLKLNIMML